MSRSVPFFLLCLILASCTHLNLDEVKTAAEGEIALTAYRNHVITRAGDSYESFDVGTKYVLYGQKTSVTEYDWSSSHDSELDFFNGVPGVEDSNHDISFSTATGSTAVYDHASQYDFYGLTFNSVDNAPQVVTNGDGSVNPSITLTEDDGVFPDLLCSDNLKCKTSSDGQLQMSYKHMLAQLSFDVSYQDFSSESNGSTHGFKPGVLKLKSIEVLGGHKSGTLSLQGVGASGKWAWTQYGASRFDASTSQSAVSYATPEPLPQKASGEPDVLTVQNPLLILPNELSNDAISVKVTLSGFSTADGSVIYDASGNATYPDGQEYERSVTYVINQTDASGNPTSAPFIFKPGYRYDISILVLDNTVRVVAIAPKVYDWVNVALNPDAGGESGAGASSDEDAVLGHPVTFGGLMWMDRNLGATSPDCENDFYKSIGYYFQFGRNVPFILDTDVWKKLTNNSETVDLKNTYIIIPQDGFNKANTYPFGGKKWNQLTDSEKDDIHKWQEECMYSIDYKGERTFGHLWLPSDREAIRFPGDVVKNADGTVNEQKSHDYYKFTSNFYNWSTNSKTGLYWSEPANQPCPKGWRVPTSSDVQAFMPVVSGGLQWSGRVYPTEYENEGVEQVKYGYYYDTSTGVKRMLHRMDILKKPGQADCYRIQLRTNYAMRDDKTGISGNKLYVTISRFTADPAKPRLEDYTEEDWANPVESTQYPGAGYITPWGDGSNPVTGIGYISLNAFGSGTIMRTSTASASTADSAVQYLSTVDSQIGLSTQSKKSLGDQIRCCRDVTASE